MTDRERRAFEDQLAEDAQRSIADLNREADREKKAEARKQKNAGKEIADKTKSAENAAGKDLHLGVGSKAGFQTEPKTGPDSEFKTEAGAELAVQSSELQLSPNGDLLKYEWKEINPGKAHAVIVPTDNLLIERSTSSPQDKQEEHPFLLTASTSVLDDYFFIHREILTWKFLVTGCRKEGGLVSCPQNQQVKFGAINPHQRSSLLVTMSFAGKEKVPVRGAERELNHFVLKSDAGEWSLWLDDQFMLVRILVASDNTEVVRD